MEFMRDMTCVRCRFVFDIYNKGSWSVSRYRGSENGDLLTACGRDLPKDRNLVYELYGNWYRNPKNGKKELQVDFSQCAPSQGREQTVAYLTSLCCGIGRKRAEEVWNLFGSNTWQVLDSSPEQLLRIDGITETIVGNIRKNRKVYAQFRRLTVFFTEIQVPVSEAVLKKIIRVYGDRAEKDLRRNPFLLAGPDGLSFSAADAAAQAMGIEKNNPERLKAGALQLLRQSELRGHACWPLADYTDGSGKASPGLLTRMIRSLEAEEGSCKAALKLLHRENRLKYAGGCLYSAQRFREEQSIADHLSRLMRASSPSPGNPEEALSEYEKENVKLSEEQREAVRNVFQNPVSIITGGPGTGKTTVIGAILAVFRIMTPSFQNPLLLAPTGKAASRMAEKAGIPASTIHSALGYRGDGSDPDPSIVLNSGLIIADECSMLDQTIAAMLLEKIPTGARLVLIGDPDQLPPTGCGTVLSDLIQCGKIPTVRLSLLFRQKEENLIAANSMKIREGNSDLVFGKCFRFVETSDDEETFRTACAIYKTWVSICGTENTVLLNPQRRNTILSVDRFNSALQEELKKASDLSPAQESSPEILANGHRFRIGDRVIQTRNTEHVRNGDTGVIRDIRSFRDATDPLEKVMCAVVEFNGTQHIYTAGEMESVDLAYAMTVHKAQGSEYRTVIQIVSSAHPAMLKRQLIYTGVTRAKENVILIGQKEALCKAIRNGMPEKRFTHLVQRMRKC